jgi:hypothetical protein
MRLLFIVLLSVSVTAQEIESSETDAILDDLFPVDSLEVLSLINDLKKQDYLYATVLYNDKVLFSGRDFGVDQYSIFPSISYIDANNFFLNIGSGYYSGIDPNWDFITFSGGYSKFINKKKNLMGTLVYSYSSYTEDVANLNNQRLSAGLSLRLKALRNSATVGYLFGGEPSFFVSNNTYYSIELLDSKKLDISIQPRLGLFWGSQTTSELVRTGLNFSIVETDVFQRLNTELSIPIEFDFGNWDLELDYTLSIPNPLPGETDLERTGFLSFSVGYLIGL